MREELKDEKTIDRASQHHVHVLRISSTVPFTIIVTAMIYGLGYLNGSGTELLSFLTSRRSTVSEADWSAPRYDRYDKYTLEKGKYNPIAKVPGEDLVLEREYVPGRIDGKAVVEWPVDSTVPLPR